MLPEVAIFSCCGLGKMGAEKGGKEEKKDGKKKEKEEEKREKIVVIYYIFKIYSWFCMFY